MTLATIAGSIVNHGSPMVVLMSIDLVVVNYHTPDDLERFLLSLERHPPTVAASLTIVDVETDADEPDTITWTQGVARRIATTTNIGYGRACNLGAHNNDGDVIALFNADVELTEGAVDRCYMALSSAPGWGVLGPRQIDTANRIRHAGIFGTNRAPRHRGWNEIDKGQYADICEAVTVAGSAYFIKRHVWNELTSCNLFRDVAPGEPGAFLPTPHYYEETYCSLHAREHGHSVNYYGPVTIMHKWHRASPVGGWAEQQMPHSRRIFRAACDHHGIAHD